MDWSTLFTHRATSAKLKASDKPEALCEVVSKLVAAGQLDADLEAAAVKTLLAREERGSTGIGMNVAIPHVKLKGLDRVVCSLSVFPDGLEWQAVDGAPVQVLFTVLRPVDANDNYDPTEHLEMMRWIATLAREPDFRRFASRSTTQKELIALLREMAPA